jgi:pyruvate-formate lyase-activating enzyme
MDTTILTWINTVVLLATVIPGFIVGLREIRKISTQVSDVATIQRAIFLQLRRQYQDIDKDLGEMDQTLKEVRDSLRGQRS